MVTRSVANAPSHAAPFSRSVLVFPEAFGLSDHALSRGQRLAEMGYVSLACDIHGNGLLLNQLDEAVGLLKPLYDDRKRMRARAGSARTADPAEGSRPAARGLDRLLLRRHDIP
jgi:dienelactone hydrolase